MLRYGTMLREPAMLPIDAQCLLEIAPRFGGAAGQRQGHSTSTQSKVRWTAFRQPR